MPNRLKAVAPLCLISVLFVLSLEVLGYERKDITTDIGKYVIHEFTELPQGMVELTADGKYVLVETGNTLTSYSLSNLEEVVGRASVRAPGRWKVVGEKVIIGNDLAWNVLTLPALVNESTIPISKKLTLLSDNPDGVPLPIDEGWLIRGLVFNDDATKVIGTMRGWSPAAGRWIDLSVTLGAAPLQVRYNGTVTFPAMRLGHQTTLNSAQEPYRVPGVVDQVELSEQGLRLVGKDFLSYPMIPTTLFGTGRCGPGWCSFQLKRSMTDKALRTIVLQVASIDKPKRIPLAGQISLAQPTLLLESKANWQHALTSGEGAADLKLVTVPVLAGDGLQRPESMKKQDAFGSQPQCWLFDTWEPLTRSRSNPDSLPALIKALEEKYVATARDEFELAIGRQAKDIPVPIQIGVQSGHRMHEYFVWTEVTHTELLHSFGSELLESYVKRKAGQINYDKEQELIRRNRITSEIADNNRRVTKAAQDEADLQAMMTTTIVSAGLSLGFGILGFVILGVLFLRARTAAILLGLLIPTQLFAQGKWEIETGGEVVAQINSLSVPGSQHQFKTDFLSGTMLMRYMSSEKQYLASVNMKTGKAISRGDYPKQWDWDSTQVSGKYAACMSSGKIWLAEIATCKVIAQADCPREGRFALLFDKALWLEPDYWFGLPSLKPVAQHPIMDPGATNRWMATDTAIPLMTSDDRCVVHGVEYDAAFKPTGKFYGHTIDLNPFLRLKNLELALTQAEKDKADKDKSDKDKSARDKKKLVETWTLKGLLQEAYPSETFNNVRVPKGENELLAQGPKNFKPTNAQPITFYPYAGGLYGFATNTLIFMQLNEEYRGLAVGVYPIFEPTFVRFDTPEVDIIGAQSDGARRTVGVDLVALGFGRNLGLGQDKWEPGGFSLLSPGVERRLPPTVSLRFGMGYNQEKARFFNNAKWDEILGNAVFLRAVVEHMRLIAGKPFTKDWNELLTAYEKSIAKWAQLAPEPLRNDFDLVPIEFTMFDQISSTELFSAFIYLPKSALQQHFSEIYEARPGFKLAFISPTDLPGQIAAFEGRKKEFELPTEPVAEAEDELPPFVEPPRVDPNTVETESSILPWLALLLAPIRVLVRAGFLSAGLHYQNKEFERAEDKVRFVGGWLGLFLVAFTWVSLEFGVGALAGALIHLVMDTGVFARLTTLLVNVLISLIIVMILVPLGTHRSIDDTSRASLSAFGFVAVLSLASLRSVFRG